MLAALVGLLLATPGWAADPPPLVLEAKIPLGTVSGRIDHFAVDPDRQRLFVAELGNDSVGVVDLKERKVLHRIAGLSEPQGVAYHAGDRHALCRQRRRRIGAPLPGVPTSRRSGASSSATMPTTSASTRGATASSSATARAGLPVIDPASRTEGRRHAARRPSREFPVRRDGLPDLRQCTGRSGRSRSSTPASGRQVSILDSGRGELQLSDGRRRRRASRARRLPQSCQTCGLRNRGPASGRQASRPAAMPTMYSSMRGDVAST